MARGNSRADPAQHGWRGKLILLDEMQVARKEPRQEIAARGRGGNAKLTLACQKADPP